MGLVYREVTEFASVDEEILQQLVNNNKPALIRNCCFGGCMQNWTLEYLEDKLKDDTVVIHESETPNLDFLNKNFNYKSVNFSSFADKLRAQDEKNSVYLRSTNRNSRSRKAARIEDDFPSLKQDLSPPTFVPYGTNNKLYHSSVLRIASSNVQIWTHFDLYNNVLCQVVGTKRVILLPPNDLQYLYIEGDKSPINRFDCDFDEECEFQEYLDKYPLVKKTTPYKCLLNPGDTLFIPALWWHNIRTIASGGNSSSHSIGFNIFWRDNELELRSQYGENDVYGNKNLKPFDFALSNLDKAIEHLEKLPEKYKSFYKLMFMNRIRSKLFPNEQSDCDT